MASVWAQGRQQSDATNPPPPDQTSVWASLDPQAQAAQQALAREPRPMVPAALSAPPPQVALAKQPPSPEQEQIGADQAKLSKLEWQDTHPWGTPENHPGKLGKVAHVFSTLGNIAGDIFAPATMANIPGTQLNRQVQEGSLAKRLETESTAESGNEYRGAEAAKDTEETTEMPGKQSDTHALDESEIAEHNAQASALLHPQAKTDFEAWQQQNPGKPIEEWLKAQAANKTQTPETEYFSEYERLHPGSTIADATKAYKRDSQAPERAPVVNVLVPDGKGGYVDQGIHPGSTVAPGAITPSGMNTMNTPTAQTRNMAEMAQTVLPQMQAVNTEVDQLAQSVGPAVGRWNQLLTNKGGADYPQFAKLDTDLDLLASAIVRTHFGARGGQQYREELKKMFGEAQSPADLKARIAGANGWLQGYAHMADRNGASGQPEGEGQMMRARDPQGVLHEAPAGTPLPAGWKAE